MDDIVNFFCEYSFAFYTGVCELFFDLRDGMLPFYSINNCFVNHSLEL